MIIHTGLRTDIPAFYSDWFFNRIKEGYVLVRNPYNPGSVTRYELSPDIVDIIVFCTKNPEPMLSRMNELSSYGQYWFVTITPYGKDIEPNVPDKDRVMDNFKKLSDIIGADSICWRYDPIFLNDKYTLKQHITDFEYMAANLSGYTNTCVISFIDLYKKVKNNFREAKEVLLSERILLGKKLIEIAQSFGINIRTCAEGDILAPYGADCRGCMTTDVFEKAINTKLNIPNHRYSRNECRCYLGSDIGAYNTCGHLCRYCYANVKPDIVKKNMALYDPASPVLCGNIKESDNIHQAKQESWIKTVKNEIKGQLKLEFTEMI